jgi:hypothetical protein
MRNAYRSSRPGTSNSWDQGARFLFMSPLANPFPVTLFITLAVLLLLTGCIEPEHRDSQPLTGDSFPVLPPTPPDVPDTFTLPVPPSRPIHREQMPSGRGFMYIGLNSLPLTL